MSQIKLYSRYNDKNGRLLIVVDRFATIDFEAKTEIPSSVKLLDVKAESTTMVTHSEFNDYIAQGRLKQIS